MTRVKKRTQQSRTAGRLGGRPRSAVNRESVGKANGLVEWSIESEAAEEVNGKFSLWIAVEIEVIYVVYFLMNVINRRYNISEETRKRREGSLSPNDMEKKEEARKKERPTRGASSGRRNRRRRPAR